MLPTPYQQAEPPQQSMLYPVGSALIVNDRYYVRWRGYAAIGFALVGAAVLISSLVLNPVSPLVLGVILLLLVFLGLLLLLGLLVLRRAQRWHLINQRRQQVAAWGAAA